MVNVAKSKINARYVWGGSGPDSFDCSGLVMWVYATVTGTQCPLLRRPDGRDAPGERGACGDLLFYGPDGSQHVALYIGRGMQIGANNPREIVVDSIEGSYWAQPLRRCRPSDPLAAGRASTNRPRGPLGRGVVAEARIEARADPDPNPGATHPAAGW